MTGRFLRAVFPPISSMLGVHSCTLGCGNTLTHSVIKMYAHCIALPAALSLSLFLSPLVFHPFSLQPLLPLVFLCRSLYLPPTAESGRATGSKTRRLQNVGQPSVPSYRLETAVCVCGPLTLRAAMRAALSEPCRLFPKLGRCSCLLPPAVRLNNGAACVSLLCETNANKSSAHNQPL